MLAYFVLFKGIQQVEQFEAMEARDEIVPDISKIVRKPEPKVMNARVSSLTGAGVCFG